MAYKTKLQVVTKIELDLDLEEEEFIQANEMTGYINDAITIIEAHMNTIGMKDRYYYKRTTLNLVQGQADYSLPTDLYEHKVREVVYSNGPTIYKISPMDKEATEEDIEYANLYQTTDFYKYRIRSDSSASTVFQLIPAARETATGVVKIGYFRDLARVVNDADLVEVPDIALMWLYQYVKVKVYEKESHENYASATAELEKLEELMLSTLQGQLADGQSQVLEMDKSFYQEMS